MALATTRPNIILILADDMGFSDIGCFGSEIATPHLDQLAADGIRFTQTYNCARCCPTRASLLTGLYPHQAGVGHMVSNRGTPAYQGYLRDDCVTIAEALRAGGYRTMLSGKWHVGGIYARNDPDDWRTGDRERPLPPDRGFDEWYGTPAGAGSYFNPKPLFRNTTLIEPEGDAYYYTDAVSEEAVHMIERAAAGDRPFFLHVSYTAPHWPLHAFEEDIARYQGRYRAGWDAIRTARHEELNGLGILDRTWDISPRDATAPPWEAVEAQDWEDRRMAVYAAQVTRMDRGIGQIVGALRQLGIARSTLVLFLSDNGGCAELLHEDGQRAKEWPTTLDGRAVRFGNTPDLMPGDAATYQSYELPWANASNTPFRLYKHWVHEGGIATPMIAYWPHVAPGGALQHAPVHVIDLMATCLDVARVPYPDEHAGRAIQPVEGESFAPALRGEAWQRERPLFWEHEGNRAVRDARWKLVSKYPGDWELYDMVADRTELHDLAASNAPQAAAMQALYAEWAERC
ncbi:MAG: arylsulfatase, partial [Anaerolineae bacterium]|nr:arylsulfatase [Anaerolineae bacterium]